MQRISIIKNEQNTTALQISTDVIRSIFHYCLCLLEKSKFICSTVFKLQGGELPQREGQ